MRPALLAALATLSAAGLAAGSLRAAPAEPSYPFEGSWVQLHNPCVAGSAHLRTYTAREVISPRGRCSIRRVAQGSGAFELQEECRHDGRTSTVTETIRLPNPDAMLLKRQLNRLKIPRQVHYARCIVAASPAPAPATPRPPRPTPSEPHRTP